MTAAPDTATDTTAPWARPLYEAEITMLGRLAEMGMGIAAGIERQVKENDAPADRAFIDFTRVARAVRLTPMLQARLIKDLEDRERLAAREADRAIHGRKCEHITQAFGQKIRLGRIVERIAEGECDHAHEVERLVGEAHERLDQDDIYGDILARPASELIATICKDLGLDPNWPKLAEEAWAREELASGAPGWPLKELSRPSARPPFKVHASSSSPGAAAGGEASAGRRCNTGPPAAASRTDLPEGATP